MTNTPTLARYVLFVLAVVLLMGYTTQAQFLTSPQPGDIYKEFSRANTSGSQWRITHSTTTNTAAQAYLPNANLVLNINDLAGAVRAEIVIDMWGGHIGTSNQKFRVNNNAWINIPKLGTANGIPAGQDGYCYINQFNPVVPIPLNNLVQGNNTFQGDVGNQLQSCPTYFNWGQSGWFGFLVRIYYNSSKPHPAGSISSPSSNGVIGENPTVAATITSGSVSQVDFLAYYDGVDYDGDGVYQEYHHSYHRLKGVTTFPITHHVGTKASAPYSVTWNTELVPNQGGIKMKALLKGTDGTYFVTNEITGLTLQRTGTVIIAKATNVPRNFWVRGTFGEKTSNFVIPAGTNLANATSAKLAIATWNGVDGQRDPGNTYYMRVNNYTLPVFGEDHHYSWDAVTVPISALVVGTNTFRVFSNSGHHGIEILWPGPSLVLRLSTGGGPVAPTITQHPADQSVSPGQTATFSVQATGTAPLSYQWQRNNSNIDGATNSSYTTLPTTLADNGATFRCVVSNNQGSVNSNSATLTVGNQAPAITQHPVNRSVNVGQTATFSVTATGTQPLTYQWQKDNVNIPGAVASSYTTPAAMLSDNGSTYRCVVTNIVTSVNSNSATLTVTEAPPPGANVLNNPGFESGTSGWSFYTNGIGAFAATGPGYGGNNAGRVTLTTIGNNMQLFQSSIPLQGNTNYTISFAARSSTGKKMGVALVQHVAPNTPYGLNSVVDLTTEWQVFTMQFTTTGFTGNVNDGRLRFFFNGHAAAGEIYSIDDVVLQVTGSGTPPPVITTHPANQTVTEGQTATFSVVATGSGLGYQWQKNNANIGGATNSSYTTPATTLADNGSTYRCIVTNTGGSVNSNAATLTVEVPGSGPNIVNNPGFESGKTGWSFYTNGTGNFVAGPPGYAGNNAARMTLTTAGNNMQLFQFNLQLEPNTDYRLTFWAYSSSGNSLGVSLVKHTTPFTGYGLNSMVGLTTGWQQYTRNFKTTGFSGNVTDGRLRFFFNGYATAGEVYYIDEVVLQKASRTSVPSLASGGTPGEPESIVPDDFVLLDNYPNPFNPETTIRFGLPEQAHVSLSVYDMLGQEVVSLTDGYMEPGLHSSVWDGRTASGTPVGSGVYMYRLVTTGVSGKTVVVQKKMLLMK